MSAGRLGLCDAARRFDGSKGGNFRTFSYFRIRGALYDMLKDAGGVSRAHYSHLMPEEQPSVLEYCKNENESIERKLPYAIAKNVSDLLAMSSVIEDYGIRLYARPLSGKVYICYAKPDDPENTVCEYSSQSYLRALVAKLPRRQRQVIQRRYYEEESFGDMSSEMGDLSKSWVSRLHSKALKTLRQMLERDRAKCRLAFREFKDVEQDCRSAA